MLEIIYDGQCPACAHYMKFMKIGQRGVRIDLRDAREHPELVREYEKRGVSLDETIVARYQGTEYTGPQALFLISKLGSPDNIRHKAARAIFGKGRMSELVYRTMSRSRRVLLWSLGRKPILPVD